LFLLCSLAGFCKREREKLVGRLTLATLELFSHQVRAFPEREQANASAPSKPPRLRATSIRETSDTELQLAVPPLLLLLLRRCVVGYCRRLGTESVFVSFSASKTEDSLSTEVVAMA
jgi:hypothetical protein